MKGLFGWLCDPYIHMMLVGLSLAMVATTYRALDSIEDASQPQVCRHCRQSPDVPHSHPCPPMVRVSERSAQLD